MKKTILFLLLAIIPTLTIAQTTMIEVNGLYYNLGDGNTATLTRETFHPYTGAIVIPESIEYNSTTYLVTGIDDTSVFNNSLTSIYVSKNITSIPAFAFYGCSALESITVDSENPIYDSRNDCNAIIEKATNKLIVGSNNSTIPDGVLSIEYGAFDRRVGLQSILIPQSVISISSHSFEGCSGLISISVQSGNPKYDSRNGCNAIILSSDDKLILGCQNTIIPNDISIIGEFAFSGCTGLQTINIPEGVTTIEDHAFEGCSLLSTLSLPVSLTTIGSMAFYRCTSLTSLTIPKNITSIGNMVILDCSNLTSISSYIVEPFPLNCFNSTTKTNVSLNVPVGSKNMYQSTAGWEFTTILEDPNLIYYTLTYKVDGENYKSYEKAYNSTITPEVAPTQAGYTFSGWSTIPETMPAEDVTITGTFTPTKYNLIYKVDGSVYKTVPTDYNSSITPENAPTREGYTFSGWSTIPATMPAEDVTITGTFTINSYNLKYKVDGEDYKTVQVEYNAAITPEAAPTREHYTFSGWSVIPATMPANDVTITGTFSINHHNLIYNVDGEQYKLYDVNYNADITPEPNPTREGYRFSGWSEIPEKMPDEDVVVNGSFLEGEYTITYKVDGVDYKVQAYNHNAPITPEPAPTKEGYSFSGWSSIPATMPAENITITGTFTICKYNLTYKLDGNVYQTSKVEYGTPLTPIANPSVAAYHTFSGWSEVPATMPAHDVDITGTSIPNKYKLEYQLRDPISGTYSTYKIKEVAYGSTITSEPAPTKEGCTFTKWTGEPTTMPYYDVLVLGGFTANYYTLTYQVKGKAPNNHSIRYGSTITPETAPTVDGFTFNGWVDLPATMPAHDVTVNASLTKNATSNVTYPADWDMTDWSEETVSNLESDNKWYKSDYRYSYQGSCPKNESIELSANGVKIKETTGVEFTVSNCSLFTISTKAGGLYNVNIEVYKPEDFFFVLKNMKRGQKVSIDFGSVDWYTDNDLFPQPVGAVKMTDSPTTRSMRTDYSVAEYVVSDDGDVRFNVNTDTFFYLYNVDVTAVSDVLLSYLGNPDGINNQIDCYLYWNGSSSTIYSSTINYARGADLRIENKSSQTMTITKIEMYEDKTVIGTFSDINGDLAPGNYKELSINVNSSIGMPSTLPWMKVYYTLNGVPYTKKFVSDGKGSATGINGHRVDGENGEHDVIYTIDGKKLNSYPTKKGLYIKNGKKFVVK